MFVYTCGDEGTSTIVFASPTSTAKSSLRTSSSTSSTSRPLKHLPMPPQQPQLYVENPRVGMRSHGPLRLGAHQLRSLTMQAEDSCCDQDKAKKSEPTPNDRRPFGNLHLTLTVVCLGLGLATSHHPPNSHTKCNCEKQNWKCVFLPHTQIRRVVHVFIVLG